MKSHVEEAHKSLNVQLINYELKTSVHKIFMTRVNHKSVNKHFKVFTVVIMF